MSSQIFNCLVHSVQTATEYLEKCLYTVRIGHNDFLNGYFPATELISRIYDEDESADRLIHRLSRGFHLNIWALIVLALPIWGAPQVPCYFSFGDSLVDNGNNNNLSTSAKVNYPPYGIDFPDGPTGRFTNGRTILDILGQLVGFENYIPPFAAATSQDIIKGVNYGSGAAGIRDETGRQLGDRISFNKQLLNHQKVVSNIASLLGSQAAANEYLGRCLYTVVIGSNDYINNYLMPQIYPTSKLYTPAQYAEVLVQQYSQQLMTLYNNGARKIALFGLGPIGCTPAEISIYRTTTCVDSVNAAVQLFNDKLKFLVDDFNRQLTDAKFIYINITSIQSGDPATIGLQILNQPCCKVSETGLCKPGVRPCTFRAIYLFWDSFHPTETVNVLTATRAYNGLLPTDAYPMDIRQLIIFFRLYNASIYISSGTPDRLLGIRRFCFIIFNPQTTLGAQQIPCFFSFGDSLVDNGNNNNLNTTSKANYRPYGIDFPDGPTGRFTNGRTIIDIVGILLGFNDFIPPFATASGQEIIKGINYGSGGAGIRDETGKHRGDNLSFNKQMLNHRTTISRIASLIGNETSARKHLNKCLYSVMIGSNDYINNYYLPQNYNSSSKYTPDQYAAALIQQYLHQLMTLYNYGARKLVLFGLGPLGCIPTEISMFPTPTCVDSINDAVQLFNDRLKQLVEDLNTKLSQAKLIYINVSSIQFGAPASIVHFASFQ
nr:uncharacterized protein LOC113728631 [Coffea arabica]